MADPRILDEAAQWLARQHAPDFSEAEQADLTRWRGRSRQHEEVWRHAEQLQSRLGSVPGAVGMAVLNRPRPSPSRRQLLRAVAWLVVTPAVGWLGYRHTPWRTWTADHRTATGERRVITLADGSRVHLNTASAISVRMDGDERLISHHAGEILVETSHRPEYAAQAFVVQTAEGRMQALGTRFTVRKHEQGTTVAVLEGAVRVTPASSTLSAVVQAGERMDFDQHRTHRVAPLAPQAASWTLGVLYAQNLRLQDFLIEVGRYREGILRCDADVADLRVSGTYQLHDTDSILALLEQTLPVRLHQRTPYWVTISRR